MTTGQKIRKLRRERNWTQAELGEKANINFSNLNRYELDRLKPGPKMLAKLALAFGVTAEDLLGGEESPEHGAFQDEELLKCFQQAQSLAEEDRAAIKRLVQAMVIKNQVQHLGRLAV
jgi:transcriptional regulator with XRE-family HTH domain